MKKTLATTLALGLLTFTTNALATPYYEAYTADQNLCSTGYQLVTEGQSYDFGFDLLQDNSVRPVTTNASEMSLSADSTGFSSLNSATIYVDLYSIDWAKETTELTLDIFANDGSTVSTLNLGTFIWNGNTGSFFHNKDTDLFFEYTLTDEQLNGFAGLGWGDLSVSASLTNSFNYNDFGITRVAIGGDAAPVPEPATMLLFGTGLAGLASIRKKRKK